MCHTKSGRDRGAAAEAGTIREQATFYSYDYVDLSCIDDGSEYTCGKGSKALW